MNKFFAILFLLSSSTYAMDDKPTAISATKSGIIPVDDEEALYQAVATIYFKSAPNQALHLKPYLRKAARQASDSPYSERLHDIVASATNEALVAQQQEIDRRWTKKKSTCCAAVTGICSALITVGGVLIVHFTGKAC